MTAEGRIAKLERALDAENTAAWEFDLEQLILLSQGATDTEVGLPRKSVKQGHPSLEELMLLACSVDRRPAQ